MLQLSENTLFVRELLKLTDWPISQIFDYSRKNKQLFKIFNSDVHPSDQDASFGTFLAMLRCVVAENMRFQIFLQKRPAILYI